MKLTKQESVAITALVSALRTADNMLHELTKIVGDDTKESIDKARIEIADAFRRAHIVGIR